MASSVVERALRREYGLVVDNLYRYRMQQRAAPDWRTGNGKPIGDVVASLEREKDEIESAAAAAGVQLRR